MDNQTEVDLNRELIVEFECPICTRYMLPPIRLCTNGHCFCQSCFLQIRKCAVCRAPKSNGRSCILEKVQSCLTFPCVHEEEGCEFQGSNLDVAVHQKACKFSWISCPLRFNDCNWQGDPSELINHCKTTHSTNIFFNSKQKLMSSKFKHRMNRIYHIVFYVFNSFFRCSWDLDEETGVMRFAVYCLGKAFEKGRFVFEVSYMQEDSNHEMVTVKAPCYPMEDDNERFIKGKYFVLHHELIKDFCDEEGDLNYCVNIIEKN